MTNVTAERFQISVRMLQSLIDSQFNGQVLMMEKSRFNFDFLSTILEFLQKFKPMDIIPLKSVVDKPRDPTLTLIQSLKRDIGDMQLLQGIEKILSKKLCSLYITTLNAIEDTWRLNIEQKRALFSLKNAIFLYKNNFKAEGSPLSLTNVSLEVSKFSALAKFINKDTGIKTVIAEKHGGVNFKELEALVAAHSERGDEFVFKFVEKNVKLYHMLRNTALEKILHQISVVHSKVKNIDVPGTAKNSVQYNQAIKRLDDIVSADQVTKMVLIEEQKFDFEFLSTILLVWRTVTSKPAETQTVVATPGSSQMRPQTSMMVQHSANASRQTLVQSRSLVPVQVVPRGQLLQLRPSGGQVAVRQSSGQLVPVRQVSRQLLPISLAPRLPVRQELGQVIQLNNSASPSPQQIRKSPAVPARQKVVEDEETADDPSPSSPGEPIIILDEDVKPSNKTLVMHRRKSESGLRPIAAVPPMPPHNKTRDIPTAEKPVKQTRVATVSNPMQVFNGEGELPIRTKCVKCNDRNSENMEQLIHHYSAVHFRDQLEADYVRSEKCPGCPEVFTEKTDLIKHIGYVHGTVQLVLTKTERWICNFCNKEFLSNDFLKKHIS